MTYRLPSRGPVAATLLALGALALVTAAPLAEAGDTAGPPAPRRWLTGWHEWRGPTQNGVSSETDLPTELDPAGKELLWKLDLPGRGTVVTHENRAYAMGYRGEKFELREVLVCLDIDTGKVLWERVFGDFLSDIIYNRYTIGAPAIDGETGNVYCHTSPGLIVAFDRDGNELWQRSMMEEFGRLTFPNGRTGCPAVDGDLVIINAITSNWGKQGPAQNRFYAFDKRSGRLVWDSSPGERPTDSSFSTPIFEWRDGRRVFYAGTGCGNLVCVNAGDGEPLWRYKMSFGGVNSSAVITGDRIVMIHGKENVDDSTSGRMIAVDLRQNLGAAKQTVLPKTAELWRNGLGMFTSSPTTDGEKVWQVTAKGDLCQVDVKTGQVDWQQKLAASQLHASPLYADGRLYIPVWKGQLWVVEPGAKKPKSVKHWTVDGQAIGSPSVWRGRIFIHTTKTLYCFGGKMAGPRPSAPAEIPQTEPGLAVKLQIVPAEILATPDTFRDFEVYGIDSRGRRTARVDGNFLEWQKFIPPTAKVKSKLDGDFHDGGVFHAGKGAGLSAGALKATAIGDGPVDELVGTTRGRILPDLPITATFADAKLTVPHPTEKGVKFAWPPLPWIGARFKWEIRQVGDRKCLAKTLDRVLFQRCMTFIGAPKLSGYTVEADVMSDGNRRLMSNVGVINQRYIVLLEGNWQQLQVLSNHDRFKVSVPFRWKPKTWYRIKCRVDTAADGSGVVRAKAWPVGTEEPKEWKLEAKHSLAHQEGSPGLYGFSPQSRFRVYIDKVEVRDND